MTTEKQKQNMNSCIIILVTHKTAGRLCEICSNRKRGERNDYEPRQANLCLRAFRHDKF